MIYFTADTHLAHENIARIRGIEVHDEILLDNINRVVGRNDELWLLGDVIWRPNRMASLRAAIRCRKVHLIRGNHDPKSIEKHFSSSADMTVRKFNGVSYHLCHFPLAEWDKSYHGSRHLHGHCHGRLERIPRRLDVGVDSAKALLGEFRPFSLEEVEELCV